MMLGSCGQTADLEDIFDSVVKLEEQHIQQGYNEGFKEGVELGKVEGRDVGLKHGFEVGEELGFYRGCINVWKAALEIEPTVFSTRVHKQIQQLEVLADKYPLLDPEDKSVQDIIDILESMRTKFKAISATLLVNLEYEGYPKSGQLPDILNIWCNAKQVSLKQVIQLEPTPVPQSIKAFAPATIANLGPVFDFFGCAIEGLEDHIIVEVNGGIKPDKILISSITSDRNRFSHDPVKNCAGMAAKATMELLGIRSVGLSLSLHKGLPLGSELGSSAGSATASALFGSKLTKVDLFVLQTEL